MTIEGAESFDLRAEDVQQFLRVRFPSVLTNQESVRRLTFTTERIPMHAEYGIPGYEGGHCTLSPGRTPSEIVITIDGLGGQINGSGVLSLLRSTLPHELMHAGDPLNAAHMDPQTRLEVLYLATQRVQSSDRLRFAYVESIRQPNPQRRLVYKMREYIAMTGESMLSQSIQSLTERYPAYTIDRRLAALLAEEHGSTPQAALWDVHMIQRLMGSGFDWEQAARRGNEIEHRMFIEQELTLPVRDGLEYLSAWPVLYDTALRMFEASPEQMSEIYMALVIPEDELGTKMDARMEETLAEQEHRARRQLPILRQVQHFYRVHIDQLQQGTSSDEAGDLLRAWMRLVDAERNVRLHRWFSRSVYYYGTMQADLHDLRFAAFDIKGMLREHPTLLEQESVRRAMMDYVRLVGYGELSLPEPLMTQAREFGRPGP